MTIRFKSVYLNLSLFQGGGRFCPDGRRSGHLQALLPAVVAHERRLRRQRTGPERDVLLLPVVGRAAHLPARAQRADAGAPVRLSPELPQEDQGQDP